eukprot:TRINITY_DN48244_c0_g1_i1.p1 TRINITY_DN48244_c0_g1~~TRINITY_DN48244_c0_g1_i1.p1  ORF type:complete len:208 (+),score=74.75 TRINITY_DN48244_c0_g1_i1:88-624(+)
MVVSVGHVLQPGRCFRVRVPEGKQMRITAACLDPTEDGPEPVALRFKELGETRAPTVAAVLCDSSPMAHLDLVFGGDVDLEPFSRNGKHGRTVHISGYITEAMSMLMSGPAGLAHLGVDLGDDDDDDELTGLEDAADGEEDEAPPPPPAAAAAAAPKKKRKAPEAEGKKKRRRRRQGE